MPAWANLSFDFTEQSREFRCSLHAGDIWNLHWAKMSFLCSQYSAILLYYLGASEKMLKFPASLSYVTSRGLPRHLCLGFWLVGWFLFLRVLTGSKEKGLGLGIFVALMLLTAAVTARFNRPHQPIAHDRIHMAAASLYVIAHIVLMDILAMSSLYRAGFYTSLAIAAASLHWSRSVKREAGVPVKHSSSAEEWRSLFAQLSSKHGTHLWCAELSFMIFENLIFTSFVLGLTSGLDARERCASV